jgi:ferredoxin
VQECLYPICTRCLDICPVISQGVILMPVAEDGRIYPVINLSKCPRCGKCFEVCKPGIIRNPNDSTSTRPQSSPARGY